VMATPSDRHKPVSTYEYMNGIPTVIHISAIAFELYLLKQTSVSYKSPVAFR